MRLHFETLVIAISLLAYSSPAYAYIDPGSGSMIMTTILGAVAAVGYTFRKYFYRLRRRLMRNAK